MPKLPPEPPRILALADDYQSLLTALKERRIALGMSQMAAEARAGLATGYVGKIEARPGFRNSRSLGIESLALLMGAYGVQLAIVPISMPGPKRAPTLAARGRKGGKRCLETMTADERRERSRRAASARWAIRRDDPVTPRSRRKTPTPAG